MIYTEEQKDIIRGLAEGKYSNLKFYLFFTTPDSDKKIIPSGDSDLYNGDLSNGKWHLRINLDGDALSLLRLNKETYVKLTQFLTVIIDLKLKSLIFTISDLDYQLESHIRRRLQPNIDQEIREWIIVTNKFFRMGSESNGNFKLPADDAVSYKDNYYPLPALQEFIKNDFKTAEELKQEQQVKFSDKQLRLQKEHQEEQLKIQNASLSWTKGIAITSIVLSLITICLTIYNNTQPSDRNVTLKNPTDTIRVINISPANGNSNIRRTLDSTKIDSTQ